MKYYFSLWGYQFENEFDIMTMYIKENIMEGLELLSFQMISFNGSARSCFVEAIQAAKEGDFERAEQLMAEGEEQFVEGHRVHAQLIQQEAQNGATQVNLLLIHAEDQMMSAEVLKIMATELIDIHKKIQ